MTLAATGSSSGVALPPDLAKVLAGMAGRIQTIEATGEAALRAHAEQTTTFRSEIRGLSDRLSAAEEARASAEEQLARTRGEIESLRSQAVAGTEVQSALAGRIAVLTQREEELAILVRETLAGVARATEERDLARGEAAEERERRMVVERERLRASLFQHRVRLQEAKARLDVVKTGHLIGHICAAGEAAIFGAGAVVTGPLAPVMVGMGAGAVALHASDAKDRKAEIDFYQADVDRLEAAIALLRAQGAE